MDYTKIEMLLNQFRQIPVYQKRAPTFMEITSYPHLENVASNVLEFYFDPSAEHNLGTLLLDALLECTKSDIEIKKTQGVIISREVSTSSGKRIDLLIEATPEACIAIENKIFHTANNDFSDYENHVKKVANGCDTLCVLLTLYSANTDAHLASFQEVLYKDFFEIILKRIGKRIINADNRYLTFLIDFIETIENLQNMKQMNKDILSFLEKNQQDVLLLLKKTKEVQDDMRKRIRGLNDLMKSEKSEFEIWNYSSGYKGSQFRETIGYEIPIKEGFCIGIAADLTLSGWQIRLKDNEFFEATKKEKYEENLTTRFGEWLKEKQISVSPHPQYQGNFIYGNQFPYDIEASAVNTEIQLLLKRITL